MLAGSRRDVETDVGIARRGHEVHIDFNRLELRGLEGGLLNDAVLACHRVARTDGHGEVVVVAVIAIGLEREAIHFIGIESQGGRDEPVVGGTIYISIIESAIILRVELPAGLIKVIARAVGVGVDHRIGIEGVLRIESFNIRNMAGRAHGGVVGVSRLALLPAAIDGDGVADIFHFVGHRLHERGTRAKPRGSHRARRQAHDVVGKVVGVDETAVFALRRRCPRQRCRGAAFVDRQREPCNGGGSVVTEVGRRLVLHAFISALREDNSYGVVASVGIDFRLKRRASLRCRGNGFLAVHADADLHRTRERRAAIGARGNGESHAALHRTGGGGGKREVGQLVGSGGMRIDDCQGRKLLLTGKGDDGRGLAGSEVYLKDVAVTVLFPCVGCGETFESPVELARAEVDCARLRQVVGHKACCTDHLVRAVLLRLAQISLGVNTPKLSGGISCHGAEIMRFAKAGELPRFGVYRRQPTFLGVAERTRNGVDFILYRVVSKVCRHGFF